MACSFCQYIQNSKNDTVCRRCGTILTCVIDLTDGVLHYGIFSAVPHQNTWGMHIPISTSRNEVLAYFNLAAQYAPVPLQTVLGELYVTPVPNLWSVRSWNRMELSPVGKWFAGNHRPLGSPHDIKVVDAHINAVPV